MCTYWKVKVFYLIRKDNHPKPKGVVLGSQFTVDSI